MNDTSSDASESAVTPLHGLHLELGGKMVPFAGYDMPVQYPLGIKGEHLHTRASAGLFDVSHMGQVRLDGADRATALEALLPADVTGLADGAVRYSFFTNAEGGILDDLMITNAGDHLYLVVNAACKEADITHMRQNLKGDVALTELPDRALIALQGPKAADVLARLLPGSDSMGFMTSTTMDFEGQSLRLSRSGYTGEDGHEISIPADSAEAFARRLLAEVEVEAIGLGARDSLRLEAGLCLYGHDIDETTRPVEAGLTWAMQKSRREEGGFPGAESILGQLGGKAPRKRVGLLPEGRAPVREGAEILSPDGQAIGTVTSGGFSPSLERPVAMGYVQADFAAADSEVLALVRGKQLNCKVVKLPFVPHNYYRG